MTYVKLFGKHRKRPLDAWEQNIVIVAFADAALFDEVVAEEFQYHCRLDVAYMRVHHRSHFTEPHNVARAIATYFWFRENHLFYDNQNYEIVASQAVATLKPDVSDPNYSIWVLSPKGF